MDETDALACLAALSQPTRLKAFRHLVMCEPEGIAAGEIARLVDVPQNTMSTHLAIMAQCGLVRSERRSRSILYRANLGRFRSLAVFLLQDCCAGRPDVCAPVMAGIAPSCQPASGAKKTAAARQLQRASR
ncbi:MAG: metalloregulator ArsR/SmtB family transcription factor [Bauldia sp.]